MAHSTAFIHLIGLLQIARRQNLQAQNRPAPLTHEQWQKSRRQFLKQSAAVTSAALATVAMPGCLHMAVASPAERNRRIAIIGGGLAGLNAAYQLKKNGILSEVYEANERLGGRVLSRSDTVANGIVLEYGGEFINSDHADMLALAQEFGLTLFNRRVDAETVQAPGSAYYLEGKAWTDPELVELLRPLVEQISRDAESIDNNWEKYAPKLDRFSVAEYLDKYAVLIPDPVVRHLFENAIRIEYGVEASESTALQLIFLLPSVEGYSVELLGYSDELYTVQGGNSRIIDGLVNALGEQIHTGKRLTAIHADGQDGYKLLFANGDRIEAEIVVVAIPFSVLRDVDLNVPLPAKLREFIQRVNLGRNDKVFAGYAERLWRQSAFSLEAWTDLGFSEAWDGSQGSVDKREGVLTYYLGGSEVNAVYSATGGAKGAGQVFTERLDAFIPKLEQQATGHYAGTGWTRNPYSRGAYVNFQPGQLTTYGKYFWVESEDPGSRQSVHAGKLIFAGEHLSDEYYGFMNGGAQTGRMASALVMRLRKEKYGT